MILHIIDDNTAIQAFCEKSVPDWRGNIYDVGFHWHGYHLVYVAKRGGPIVVSINELSPDSMGLTYYYRLFRQPDSKWHTDPETGNRIEYRYMHPVEYVFGV